MEGAGGEGEEAEGEALLGSRREWREDHTLMPKGWRMGWRGWREEGSCLPTGWR